MKIDEKLIKDVAKKTDKVVDFKKLVGGVGGNVAELIDGHIFKFALMALNDYYGDKIPDEYNEDIEVFLTAYVTGEWGQVDDYVVERVNEVIDVPYLDETAEGTIIGALLKGLVNLAGIK